MKKGKLSSKALSDIAITRRMVKKSNVIQLFKLEMLGNGVRLSKIGFFGKEDRMM